MALTDKVIFRYIKDSESYGHRFQTIQFISDSSFFLGLHRWLHFLIHFWISLDSRNPSLLIILAVFLFFFVFFCLHSSETSSLLFYNFLITVHYTFILTDDANKKNMIQYLTTDVSDSGVREHLHQLLCIFWFLDTTISMLLLKICVPSSPWKQHFICHPEHLWLSHP